jgi:CheY-like chemotaxis protein
MNSAVKHSMVIVDNQVLIQDFFKFSLSDVFQVVSVYSAEQALNRLKYFGPFDIILSSLSLPGMNGLELLRNVHELYPQTIRILMSGGHIEPSEISRALENGDISRFLQKPFSPSALKNQLKSDLASFNAIT